ncbi:hypothetical protein L9F63_016627 [Diploptera punctata]|uniref:Uncharacterized protein n=1 Tax=Diploptera punctata TaxID=6984 RepID=A0AAD8A0B3_DIPPU|nr:hypothetical protein L9F63_016627 [Diploptera punctata]
MCFLKFVVSLQWTVVQFHVGLVVFMVAKKSTDEQSVNLVTDAIEKGRRVTCEELSEATGIS